MDGDYSAATPGAMAAPATSAAATGRRTAAVVCAATVLDLVAFACILPSLPSILQHYESVATEVRVTGALGVAAVVPANQDAKTRPQMVTGIRTAGFAGWVPPAITWLP